MKIELHKVAAWGGALARPRSPRGRRHASPGRSILWALLGAIAVVGAACHGIAHASLYAVVVAQNRSLDAGVKPLRYADDDGVRTFELLSLFARKAALFVVLDEDTARLHPSAARRAEVPERAAILARLEQFNRQMERDIERGDVPELFFYYAGHGDVDASGQGYINLHDARLTRSDLYREILKRSKASYLHVIIDACKSYWLVSSRGGKRWVDDSVDPTEERDTSRRLRAFLQAERLDGIPRAGVIVATSGDQETHEWSRYRGGILSHELRSGLAGAADVNGDGRVEYSELAAFLAAANARLQHPQARIDVFSRAPAANRRRPLLNVRRPRQRKSVAWLRFDGELSGRLHVIDDRGVRFADVNKERGSRFDLVVPAGRTYFVRRDDADEAEVRARPGRFVRVAQNAFAPMPVAARGGLDTSFRAGLNRVPYGPRFYEGYVARSGDVPVDLTLEGTGAAKPVGRHALSFGYLLSTAPAGDAGMSHGIDLRYAFSARRWLEVGGALEVGYGAGGALTPTSSQSLARTALLGTVAGVWSVGSRASLRLEAAAGWQMLSGDVSLSGTKLTGTELRGLRLEAAAGVGVRVSRAFEMILRGGLALDAAFPAEASRSAGAGAFGTLALRWRP